MLFVIRNENEIECKIIEWQQNWKCGGKFGGKTHFSSNWKGFSSFEIAWKENHLKSKYTTFHSNL